MRNSLARCNLNHSSMRYSCLKFCFIATYSLGSHDGLMILIGQWQEEADLDSLAGQARKDRRMRPGYSKISINITAVVVAIKIVKTESVAPKLD